MVVSNEVDGNVGPKMLYQMIDQKGGRFATKDFSPLIAGSKIHFNVDWYPGEINDKRTNKDENGGMITLVDTNKKAFFTTSFIRNECLRWVIGKNAAVETSFKEAKTWYSFDLEFDIKGNKLTGTITDKKTGKSDVQKN